MSKILSGRLTAFSNLDGAHLERYIERAASVKNALCEELILNEEIIIPTQDYLTACGLARIVGERSLIVLLEQEKIKFARLRGSFGYVRGTGLDGTLVAFEDPNKRRPQDSDIESAIDSGLSVISGDLQDRAKLTDLLIRNSIPFEMSEIVDSIKHDSYRDLRETILWKPAFEMADKGLLALPGLEPMQVRVIGPEIQPAIEPVDALLALARYNLELHLSRILSCGAVSSGSPLGDLLQIKVRRITGTNVNDSNLWTLLDVNGVPDFAEVDFVNSPLLEDFLRVCSSAQARSFREWFHNKQHVNERELLREYIALLQDVPWIQRLPAKILRFLMTTGIGLVPGAGAIASFLDTFVVDQVLGRRSARFFIEHLKDFRGKIKLKNPA